MMKTPASSSHTRQSPTVACVVVVKARLLPGYTDNTLKSLGGTVIDGARTTIYFAKGPYSPAHLVLQHSICQHEKPDLVVGWIYVPLAKLSESLQIASFPRTSSLRPRLGVKTLNCDASHIRLVFQTSDAVIYTPLHRLATLHPDQQHIVNGWTSAFDQATTILDIFLRRDTRFLDAHVTPLKCPQMNGNWMEFFKNACKRGSQLSFINVNMEFKRHLKPEPAVDIWTNEFHRMATLQVSAREEFGFDQARSEKMADAVHQARFTALPSSRWSVSDKDAAAVFGCEHVPRDSENLGPPLQYLIRVTVDEQSRDLLPEVGDAVHIECGTIPRRHRMPAEDPDDTEYRHTDIASDIHESLSEEHELLTSNVEELQSDLEDALQAMGKHDEGVKRLLRQLDETPKWSKDRNVAMLSRFCSHAIPADLTRVHGPLEARSVFAEEQLRVVNHPSLSDDEWLRIIVKWCQDIDVREEAGPTYRPDGTKTWEPGWRGRRVNAPAGIAVTPDIFILVSTPRERDWPYRYRSPPMDFCVPSLPLSGSIDAYYDQLMSDPKYIIPVRMYYRASDTTAREEMAGVCRAADTKESTDNLLQQQWKYTRAFTREDTLDFAATFPTLDVGQFDKVHRPVFDNIHHVPAGMLLVEGVAGSGKTTVAAKIAAQVCRVPRRDIVVRHTAAVEAAFAAAAATKAAAEAAETARKEALRLEGWEFGEASFKDIEPSWARHPPQELPPFGHPVFWCAPSHALCRDVISTLEEKIKDIPTEDPSSVKIAHVYPFGAEIAALGYVERDSTEDAAAVVGAAERSIKDASLEAHADHPTSDEYSLAQTTKRFLAQSYSPTECNNIYSRYLLAMKTKCEGPPYYSQCSSAKDFAGMCRELLIHTAKHVQILVGTPVSLGQLGRRWATDSKLTIIDDAARMSEASFWIVPSRCPGPVLAIGDPFQLSPVARNADTGNRHSTGWKSTFGPQRQRSLLHRAANAHATEARLTHIYKFHMSIPDSVTSDPRAKLLCARVNDALKRLTAMPVQPEGNSWVVDVVKPDGQTVPPSWPNTNMTAFALDLTARLSSAHLRYRDFYRKASILLIAPNAAVAAILRAGLAPDDAYSSDVECRTVGSSMSHEADIVIIVHTLDDELGFSTAADRMAVTTTRARFAQIFITCTTAFKPREHQLVSKMIEMHKTRNAYLRTA